MNANNEYYRQTRSEMLNFVPEETGRLLDIGCSEGYFGDAVSQKIPGCETWGVEANADAAAQAAGRNHKVLCGLIDLVELPDSYFDVVTMNDVLEHIPYSEPALAVVRRVLKPNGRLVLSVPNVRYYLNVRDLVLRGRWDYQEFGVLDRTHLRFFTLGSIKDLLGQNGFEVQRTEGLNAPQLKTHYRLLFALAPRSFADMKFPQIAVVSQRTA